MENIKVTIQRTKNISRFNTRKQINAKTLARKQTPQKTRKPLSSSSPPLESLDQFKNLSCLDFYVQTQYKTKQTGMCEQFPYNKKNPN